MVVLCTFVVGGRLQEVYEEDLLGEVKLTVARSFPDQEPFRWGDGNIVHEHMDHLHLEHTWRVSAWSICSTCKVDGGRVGQKNAPHPSVRVLGGLVVVPDAQSSDGLGLGERHAQGVGLSIGERDQPHVLVVGGDVVAIYKPE